MNYKRKSFSFFSTALIFLLLFALVCCKRKYTNVTQNYTAKPIQEKNPQYRSIVGPAGAPANNFVDIRLRIDVTVLNSAGNAIAFNNSPYIKTFSCNSTTPFEYLTQTINIPNDGAFVIQVTTQATECTIVNRNIQNCSTSGPGTTTQYYGENRTYTSQSSADYNFLTLIKQFDECCQ